MLSSVANRCYWVGRYLERSENTARLLSVYSSLLLDVPKEAGVDWLQLMEICGCGELFGSHRRWPLERSAVRFLTVEADNPGSIISSVRLARENLRTLRDVVPKEAFEALNEFYLFSNDRIKRAVGRRARHQVLNNVIGQCQKFTGLISGTMSRNEAYRFLQLGCNLERADMTTRILDVAGDLLTTEAESLDEYETMLWVNVLRSLSGYQAYRQSVRSRIAPVRVLHFLLNDDQFPRAIEYCLDEIENATNHLPSNEEVIATVDSVRSVLGELSLRELVRESLHEELDVLQQRFEDIHVAITKAWLLPEQRLTVAN